MFIYMIVVNLQSKIVTYIKIKNFKKEYFEIFLANMKSSGSSVKSRSSQYSE